MEGEVTRATKEGGSNESHQGEMVAIGRRGQIQVTSRKQILHDSAVDLI